MFPKGASATGTVVGVERSGRLSHPGELRLELRTISYAGHSYRVKAEPFVIQGESHTASNVSKIGGGAAAGAIIGAIAGGGKGAAIGAGAGAATGTGVAAATGKKEATVESEAILAWVAASPQVGSRAVSPVIRASRTYREEPREADARDDHGHEAHESRSEEYEEPTSFSARDRQIILSCFGGSGHGRGLPPGLAKKNRLPPGLERQVQRNGTLPPGLQKKVQSLPEDCEARLPRLPQQWSRVVLSGRILLLDSSRRIVDLFWLVD
jgi:hypothetical protein